MGLLVRASDATYQARTLTLGSGASNLLSLANGSGVGGNPTLSLPNRAANLFLAGPSSGAAAAPSFRALAVADLPSLASTDLTVKTVQTEAPDSGTAAKWKLGVYDATVPTADGRIQVQIGDTAYYVPAEEISGGFTDPTDIADLALWLDASDSTTLFDATSGGSAVAADGAVLRWEDKSGNDRHATQSVTGREPVRKTGIQNSLDILRFDRDWMDLGTQIPRSANYTTFIVLAPTQVSDSLVFILGARPTNGADIGCWGVMESIGSGNLNWRFGDDTNGSKGTVAVLAATTWALLSMRYTAGDTDKDVWQDGALETPTILTSAASSCTGTVNRYQIGNHNDQTGVESRIYQGDIAEIVIYGRALNSTERGQVETYLQDKWATPALP